MQDNRGRVRMGGVAVSVFAAKIWLRDEKGGGC